MKYLNLDVLREVSEDMFLNKTPFPWLNPQGGIHKNGFSELVKTLPDISLFEKSFGVERAYGQKSHDRFELRYSPELVLSPAWQGFINELSGSEYRSELIRLFGTKNFSLRFQWQYAHAGCSVSPHCDSVNKVGSHIFYFNTSDDWVEEWGGNTVILGDHGKLDCDSSPDFAEFDTKITAHMVDNYSLLFARTDHSWHSFEELCSPPHAVRKVFTVIVEKKVPFSKKIIHRLTSMFVELFTVRLNKV